MNETKSSAGPPSEVDVELQEAMRRAMSGVRDPEEMRKACERMDRMREEVYKREAILDIGVPAIRELRGELPDA
jgi:succinate dehydrogenase/fumarate reductase flavoprotein subunit